MYYPISIFLPEAAETDQGVYLYNTYDKRAYFVFRFVNIGAKYDICILSQPNYCSKSNAMNVTYKTVGEPDYIEKIHFLDEIPTTLSDAKTSAKWWAEMNWNYIKTGTRIQQQIQSEETKLEGKFILPSELFNKGLYLYPTEDGESYFIYNYVQVSNYFEADIIAQPQYALMTPRVSCHDTHRLDSTRPHLQKICITSGKEPRDLEGIQDVSKGWSELTWSYIKTGKTLDEQVSNNYPVKSWFQKITSIFN
jgi:hypothetical protein